MRSALGLAAIALCGGCFGLFEAYGPDGLCAPFESQTLDLDTPNRAGFSGADMLSSLEAVDEVRIDWVDAEPEFAALVFETEPDARVSLVTSADGKTECDSEVSEVELPVTLRIEGAAEIQRWPGAARPLLSAGQLKWVSFDAPFMTWELGGLHLGDELRVKVRAPFPASVQAGDEVGSVLRSAPGCDPAGETGGECDDEVVATLVATTSPG